VQAVDAVHAVAMHLDEGEPTGVGVAGEDRQCVVDLAGGQHVGAVGAHGDPLGVVQAVDAADAVPENLEEGEQPGRRIAAEDGERVVVAARGVHVRAVGAHVDRARLGEAIDAPDAVLHHLEEGEQPGRGSRRKTATALSSLLAA